MSAGAEINTIGYFLQHAKEGEVYYTHKEAKDVTAHAHYHKAKVTTERVMLVDNILDSPTAAKITKVTMVATKTVIVDKRIPLTPLQVMFINAAINVKEAVLPLDPENLDDKTFAADYGFTKERMIKEIKELSKKLT